MITIRLFEQSLLDLSSKGEVQGTIHTYIGMEATGVGVISSLNVDKDYVISNHRNHGHYLSFSGSTIKLFSEILGRKGALCDGYGGSQHLQSARFLSHGILGGTTAITCGIALSLKLNNLDEIVCIFLGDGALGEGLVYESFNIASLWDLPILFVIENNNIAQTTPLKVNCAGSLQERTKSFGIKTTYLQSTDVEEIYQKSTEIVSEIRQKKKCQTLIIECPRLAPHSKGDDTRTIEEIQKLRLIDPILLIKNKLGQKYDDIYIRIREKINSDLDLVLRKPKLDKLLNHEIN